MNYPEIYRSKVYEGFKEIEPNDYRELIHYFEINEKRIKKLEFEPYFEILVTYINALFEFEKFLKHLEVVDLAIEASIANNIKWFGDEDIYRTLLYQKAVASFRTLQFTRSDHILRELIRMDVNDENSTLLLEKTLKSIHPAFLQKTRAAGILLFFVSAIVICLEVILFRTLMPDWLSSIEIIRNVLFLSGWIVLSLGELKHYLNVKKEINHFIHSLSK
ncbi:hypothetical protein OAF63_07400 [Saprospiraceae bacterium]|jgi:hypothetical protein|nr:hypothetical protein [Bacteroidota bacterium]MDB4728602.1 hypothetical protein [Saprospiraceae bacterium]